LRRKRSVSLKKAVLPFALAAAQRMPNGTNPI
jgi:hypothetical protein